MVICLPSFFSFAGGPLGAMAHHFSRTHAVLFIFLIPSWRSSRCQWSPVRSSGWSSQGCRSHIQTLSIRTSVRRIELTGRRSADTFNYFSFSSYPRTLVTQPGQDNATRPDLLLAPRTRRRSFYICIQLTYSKTVTRFRSFSFHCFSLEGHPVLVGPISWLFASLSGFTHMYLMYMQLNGCALAQTVPTRPCILRLNVKRLRDCNPVGSDSWHLDFSSTSRSPGAPALLSGCESSLVCVWGPLQGLKLASLLPLQRRAP